MDMRIDGENVRGREMIFPAHLNRPSAADLKCRPWVLTLKSPNPGRRKLRMQPLCIFPHANAIEITVFAPLDRGQAIRNGKRVDVAVQRSRCAVASRLRPWWRGAGALSAEVARKNQARYRCGAEHEKLAPAL